MTHAMMKNTVSILLALALITITGCTAETPGGGDENGTNQIIDIDENKLCLIWNSTIDDVLSAMKGYKIIKQTDEILAFAHPKTKKTYIVYGFSGNKLRASLLVSSTYVIDSRTYTEGKEHLGNLDDMDVYIDIDKNTVVYLDNGSSYSGFIGFTPIESSLYEALSTIVVTTGDAVGITSDSAVLSGEVSSAGSNNTKYGILYGENMDLQKNGKIEHAKTPSFSLQISGLNERTTYYYCAFALEDGDYYLGDISTFVTSKCTAGTANGHEWVDLGLPSGLLWATCNVDANKPYESGGYYSWGETTTKSVYSVDTYSLLDYVINAVQYYKYVGNNISGTSYDVAHVKWGDDWKMPTLEQCKELDKYTKHEQCDMEGVTGLKFTGDNGNSIFFPYAGYKSGSNAYMKDRGYYWTASSQNGYASSASCMQLLGYAHFSENLIRSMQGTNVRPVLER